jgi:hypothetical protein
LLEKSNIQDIRNNFYKQGIEFIEEIHVSNGTVNNNIDSILRQVQSFETFKSYLSGQLSEFIVEFEKA